MIYGSAWGMGLLAEVSSSIILKDIIMTDSYIWLKSSGIGARSKIFDHSVR
jgi:hypothetical protein